MTDTQRQSSPLRPVFPLPPQQVMATKRPREDDDEGEETDASGVSAPIARLWELQTHSYHVSCLMSRVSCIYTCLVFRLGATSIHPPQPVLPLPYQQQDSSKDKGEDKGEDNGEDKGDDEDEGAGEDNNAGAGAGAGDDDDEDEDEGEDAGEEEEEDEGEGEEEDEEEEGGNLDENEVRNSNALHAYRWC